MPQKLFFFSVFLVQIAIAVLDYILAYKCYKTNEPTMGFVNILAGLSWTATGFYKLWEFFIC